MSHPRTLLRNAVAARLAGLRNDGQPWTAAGTRVIKASAYEPASTADLPALLVFGWGEKIPAASYPMEGEEGQLRRNFTVLVDCVVAAGATAEDDIDGLAEGVEAALEWLEVPGLATASIRLNRSYAPLAGSGSVATVTGRLSFEVAYHSPWRRQAADVPYQPVLLLSRSPEIGTGHESSYEELWP